MINWLLKIKIAERFKTQADFSYFIKRPETIVSKVIRGRYPLKDKEKQRWAGALGVDVNELFKQGDAT
jgi:hypothetical protein